MKRVCLVLALCLASACASLTVQERATKWNQATLRALAAAQDIERAQCFVTPATEQGPKCSNPLAATIGLTDANHVAISRALAAAFTAVHDAAVVIDASGTVPTANLSKTLADLQATLTQIQSLQGTDVLAKFISVIQNLQELIKTLGGA